MILIILIINIIKNKQKFKYNIGDTVQISGEIAVDNNYPTNTHQIFNDDISLGTKK